MTQHRHESSLSRHKWGTTICKHLCLAMADRKVRLGSHKYFPDKDGLYQMTMHEVEGSRRTVAGSGGTMREAIRDGLKQLGLWSFTDTLAYADEECRRTLLDIGYYRNGS